MGDQKNPRLTPYRFIDDLLDLSLAQYRSVEPRPGLENRVLARLHSARRVGVWFEWGWRLAGGLAALGIVGGALYWQHRGARTLPATRAESPRAATAVGPPGRTGPASSASGRVNSGSAWTASVLPAGPLRRAARRRARIPEVRPGILARGDTNAAPEPRADTFPSPRPLSTDERLLQAYVRQGSPPDLLVFHTLDQPFPRLEIEELKVPPLSGDATRRAEAAN